MTTNVKTHGSDLAWFEDIVSDPTLVDGQVGAYNKGGDFTIKDDDDIVSTVKDVYGSMYADMVSETIGVAIVDTPYEVTAGITTGAALQGCTFGDAHYVAVDYAGMYLITWSMTITSSTASDEVMGGIMVNGVKQDAGTCHATVSANSKSAAVAGSAILALSANDQLSLCIQNHTAVRDVDMQHASLTVVRIGE